MAFPLLQEILKQRDLLEAELPNVAGEEEIPVEETPKEEDASLDDKIPTEEEPEPEEQTVDPGDIEGIFDAHVGEMKTYTKRATIDVRPGKVGEVVDVTSPEKESHKVKRGDMVARDADDITKVWIISKKELNSTFEELGDKDPDAEGFSAYRYADRFEAFKVTKKPIEINIDGETTKAKIGTYLMRNQNEPDAAWSVKQADMKTYIAVTE